MEEYLVSVRALLGVLGHRVLEPYTQPIHTITFSDSSADIPPQPVAPTTTNSQLRAASSVYFTLHIGGISATAERTDEGLVVLAGSEAALTAQGSLSGGYRLLREKLLESGTLASANGRLKFTKDQLFTSPSQAAAVLVGYAINGRDAWRLKDGTTYSAYEQKISSALFS